MYDQDYDGDFNSIYDRALKMLAYVISGWVEEDKHSPGDDVPSREDLIAQVSVDLGEHFKMEDNRESPTS